VPTEQEGSAWLKAQGVIEPTVRRDPDYKGAEYVLSVGGVVRINGEERDIREGATFWSSTIEMLNFDRVVDTVERDEQEIAARLDDPATVFLDRRIDDTAPECTQPVQCVLVIRRSIRRNVGMQDQNTHECMPLVLPFGRRRHLKPQRGDY